MVRKQRAPASFKIGDLVKIRLSSGARGRIVELRGPLGPGGALIYRVRVRRKPRATYIDVRGDQLDIIPEASRNTDALARSANASR